MHRREFIKQGCGLCVGGIALTAFLQACKSASHVQADIKGDELLAPLSSFREQRDGKEVYKKYIVLQNDQLRYPIYVYRDKQGAFSAVWLQCSHQGSELQVFGEKLQCPAHGSEFDPAGKVLSGPADKPLRKFSVVADTDVLRISLRK